MITCKQIMVLIASITIILLSGVVSVRMLTADAPKSVTVKTVPTIDIDKVHQIHGDMKYIRQRVNEILTAKRLANEGGEEGLKNDGEQSKPTK